MLKGRGLTVLARFLTSIQTEMPSCCAPGLRGNPGAARRPVSYHYEEYLLKGGEGKDGGPCFLRNRSSDHDPIAPRVLGTVEGDIGGSQEFLHARAMLRETRDS